MHHAHLPCTPHAHTTMHTLTTGTHLLDEAGEVLVAAGGSEGAGHADEDRGAVTERLGSGGGSGGGQVEVRWSWGQV